MSTHEQIQPTGGHGDDASEASDAAGQAQVAGVDDILDEIDSFLLRESKSIAGRHYGAFGIVLHNTHFAHTNLLVYAILRLSWLFAVVSIGSQMCETIGFVNCLYAD